MGTGDPGQCCSVTGKSTRELYCQNCRPQDWSIPSLFSYQTQAHSPRVSP